MQTLTMMQGLPASGKTTRSKQLLGESPVNSIKRVNKDDLREMLDASVWSKGNENMVLDIRDHIIKTALLEGKDVISDDTNFEPKHRARFLDIIKEVLKEKPKKQIKFEVEFLNTPVEQCLQNNRMRARSVPEGVIRAMHNKFLRGMEEKPAAPKYDDELPDCLIVDLDGTLAHMTDRGPYEPLKASSDRLDETLANILYILEDRFFLVFVSARDGSGYDVAREWLVDNGFLDPILLMRDAGDYRKDAVVKEEIYETCIKGKWNVHLVFDDRDQVVKMWRSKGLTCYQVANGGF